MPPLNFEPPNEASIKAVPNAAIIVRRFFTFASSVFLRGKIHALDQNHYSLNDRLRFFLELRIALIFLRKVEKENLASKLAFASNYDDQTFNVPYGPSHLLKN